MGLFDSVYVACPHCEKLVEFQTKADEAPYMRRYTLTDAPDYMLVDILNKPQHCQSCDGWFALLDQRYPIVPPRPNPIAAKVKTPPDASVHEQGFKWWPWERRFTVKDLVEITPSSPDLKASQRPTVSSETNPARPPSLPGREDVARIIDPGAFHINLQFRHRYCSPLKVEVVQERALTKADAILALNPPTQSHLAGKGEL